MSAIAVVASLSLACVARYTCNHSHCRFDLGRGAVSVNSSQPLLAGQSYTINVQRFADEHDRTLTNHLAIYSSQYTCLVCLNLSCKNCPRCRNGGSGILSVGNGGSATVQAPSGSSNFDHSATNFAAYLGEN